MPTRDRSKLYRISMDLGSDSTVCYVAVPGENDYKQIDLQYFLKALAAVPDLLLDANGRPSHRLKSRYAVNSLYTAPHEVWPRMHRTYGYTEVLPEGHAQTTLVDFSPYIRIARSGGSKVDYARNGSRCFFKFIDDESAPFPATDLLPNAKLIFQSGVGLDRTYEINFDGNVEWIKVHPVEIIKNQVCLILENFIRHHPELRNESNEAPDWSDCVVILTVPNTYSPYHREMLAVSVNQTLGCQVETITESDAVVFYYIAKLKPDSGLSSKEMEAMEQKYLTIDIGKGTTDLTLMSITHRDASAEEKESRGISPAVTATMKHVYVDARTGRASGGAKMTFILARFFESLIDFSLRKTLDGFSNGLSAAEVSRLRDLKRSPFRLTTRSTAQIPEDSAQSRRLLEFERLCDSYKREMDMAAAGLYLPDLGVNDKCIEIADYISQITLDQASAIHGVMLTLGQKAQVRTAVLEVLQHPNSFRPIPTQAKSGKALVSAGRKGQPTPPDPYNEALEEIWSDFERDVDAYVTENAEEVLIELAQAHADCDVNVRFDDAAQALAFLMDSRTGGSRSDGFQPKFVRTHIVLAGQGSQFKPLKKRFATLMNESGFGTIYSEQKLKELGTTTFTSRARAGSKQSIVNKVMSFMKAGDDLEAPPSIEHMAVELSGSNLKDGCAYGALYWYSSNPAMINPDAIHGQLIVTDDGGSNPEMLDMVELNSSRSLTISRSAYGAHSIYYLASKGSRYESGRIPRGSLIGTVEDCNQIVVQIRPPKSTSHVVFSTERGQVLKLKDSIYGAEDAKSLREMLWPAMLLDE